MTVRVMDGIKIHYSTLTPNIITAVIVGWRREQAQCTPIHIAGVTWE